MWTTPSAAGASFAAGTTAAAHNDNRREDNLNESSERGSTSPSEEDSTCAATSSSPRRSPKDADNNKAEERATLARRENVIVIRMKGVVAVVLLAATILVSIGVLWYTRADQESDFKESFKADANRLLESFHKSLERTLEAVDALSVAITAHALETNSTFPFVNLPNSAFRYGNTLRTKHACELHSRPICVQIWKC
jgi:hypothetical protein